MVKVNPPHISVCVATYRRPIMLSRCLEALHTQKVGDFTYSIVVVDNDVHQSGKEVVSAWQTRSDVGVSYGVEPEQNISRARNRAIANAGGDLIAFIDDDEFPGATWLLTLLDSYMKYSVDGVLGPVIPSYEGVPAGWLIKSGLCNRTSFETGTILNNSRYMRTGNVLFSKEIIRGLETPFDPRHGLTGGEDAHFFESMLCAGRSFVWCNEAEVYEEVPKERQKMEYFVRRALIRGVTTADHEPVISVGTIKSLVAMVLYTLSLPILIGVRYHLFAKYLIKDCDHVAKLLAHCGIKLVRKRTF